MSVSSTTGRRLIWAGLGLVVFAVAGVLAGRFMAPTPAFALATHGSDNLTAVTGPVEGAGAEAVIYLDHVTGELTGYVISSNSWQVIGRYSHPGVNQDLQLGNVKNPKYTVVTGSMAFKPQGQRRLGSCVIYVAEETTGQMVAYGIPWNAGDMNLRTLPARTFVKLAGPLKVSSAVRRGGGTEVEVEDVKEPAKKPSKKN